MTEKQILKKIDKALALLMQKDIRGALRVLMELKTRLEMEMKEEEETKGEGKKLQHLMGWYISIWNNQPPESFRFTDYKYIIGKHLRELLEIYERNGEDIETLKRDYEAFKNSRKDWNGILQFRQNLPNIKKAKGSEWSSPENQRGKDYYLKGWGEEKEGKNKLWEDHDDEIPLA
ncbi:conserved hypothetical protein [Hydrogenobacter thermophilus TK-6]|uniref:Uncharacterized protein n=1 Tax=Hydrogenobacter thermophilus (strain DSM 6534 / IAM 12695 / TK-6) TaxID=608538 RepID=D3DHR5_HYDTT|nr:hypothetical protein [Hydrogenobacter thermophilus]ADO45302.1 conserved hypothetical protein [Hydrogenobacter thermophilus TK-6]BAI69367.1 hypothetical protein HTH_0908 [Hydrogenobacter thermophilus TK-6]